MQETIPTFDVYSVTDLVVVSLMKILVKNGHNHAVLPVHMSFFNVIYIYNYNVNRLLHLTYEYLVFR